MDGNQLLGLGLCAGFGTILWKAFSGKWPWEYFTGSPTTTTRFTRPTVRRITRPTTRTSGQNWQSQTKMHTYPTGSNIGGAMTNRTIPIKQYKKAGPTQMNTTYQVG